MMINGFHYFSHGGITGGGTASRPPRRHCTHPAGPRGVDLGSTSFPGTTSRPPNYDPICPGPKLSAPGAKLLSARCRKLGEDRFPAMEAGWRVLARHQDVAAVREHVVGPAPDVVERFVLPWQVQGIGKVHFVMATLSGMVATSETAMSSITSHSWPTMSLLRIEGGVVKPSLSTSAGHVLKSFCEQSVSS